MDDMDLLIANARRLEITAKKVSDNIIEVPEYDFYAMEGKPGCVLIISNPFVGQPEDRQGASEKDVKNMKSLWEEVGCEFFDIRKVDANTDQQSQTTDKNTSLRDRIAAKYRNKAYEGVTAQEIKELLKSLSEINRENYSYIVVVISSHGGILTEDMLEERSRELVNETTNVTGDNVAKIGVNAKAIPIGSEILEKVATAEVFFGEDWMPVREKEMIGLFYKDTGNETKNFPKFFILDYCRFAGNATETAFAKMATIDTEMSDTIIAYATHRSHRAYDDDKDGSWLITAIEDVFSKDYKHLSVLDMLTKVNEKISKKVGEDDAMSIFESSLVKKFYLKERSDVAAHEEQAEN